MPAFVSSNSRSVGSNALVRRARGDVERLERGGRPVGFPAAAPYRESVLCLAPGDFLAVFSDGLVEGCGCEAEDLVACVEPGAGARTLVEQLIERAPKQELIDDVTVLVLKSSAART